MGTGFLVSLDKKLALTCAHVIKGLGKGPGDTIKFYFLSNNSKGTALVLPETYNEIQDIAILSISSPIPNSVTALTVVFPFSRRKRD